MEIQKKILLPLWKLINDYPVVFVAVVIYVYYLFTSINLFEHARERKGFLDYVLQFDSLIWMWIAAAALLQVQKMRKRQKEATEERHQYQAELDRQRIENELLDEITALLQDNVNNPLAIISLKAQEIRRKFDKDIDITRWLDSIEAALKRIEQTIRDLRGYEAQKMIKTAQERISKIQSTSE